MDNQDSKKEKAKTFQRDGGRYPPSVPTAYPRDQNFSSHTQTLTFSQVARQLTPELTNGKRAKSCQQYQRSVLSNRN
jgi:hypothetical protein